MDRPFSLASPPSKSEYELLVKLMSGGVASTFFETAEIGDRIHFSGPHGNFHIDPNHHAVRLIASSTGIAPFRAILPALLDSQKSPHAVTLVSIPSIGEPNLLSEEFEALTSRYNHFRYIPVTDFGAYLDTLAIIPEEDIYLCGGPNFLHDIKTALLVKGADLDQIHYEEFK